MANARILVVEDESPIVQLIDRFLRNSSYTICGAVASGEEALSEAHRLQPDLVLMDIALKGQLDGVETAQRLQTQLEVPIIFLTGLHDEATMQRTQEARASGFVLKPFRREELQASIDIALHKHKLERQLRKIEYWFTATIKSISDAVITTDAEGCITFLNPVAAALTGWLPDDALGRSLDDVFRVIDGQTRAEAGNPVTRVVTRGITVRFSGTMVLQAREATEIPIEASVAPIRNDHSQIIGVVLIFRDVTERQRAEAALRASEDRFLAFMDHSPVIAFIKDEAGRYVFGNRAWTRQFNRPLEDLLGKTDYDLWPEDTAKLFRESDLAAIAAHQATDWIESARQADGTLSHWMIFKFALRDSTGGRLLGGLALDVTARNNAESELSRSREQLRSLAAHLQSVREEERTRIAREIHDQLGQMLTGLKMDLSWIERRVATLGEKVIQASLLDKTKSMGDLLGRMIKSVRRISAELRPGVLDDLGLVAALEWQAREFQGHTNIPCAIRSTLTESAIPSEIGTAAFRIFQETLTNVARHAQATEVTADLKADGGQLLMTVRDNGRGITDTELVNRTSLGLLGMRERASILGGDFKITGQSGQGTTVTVRIPLTQP